MTVQLDVIGLVVADPAASLDFYTRLGVRFGNDFGGHWEAELPGGFRLTLDTEETIRSFHPAWRGGSGRMNLAFRCPDPAAVDTWYDELTAAGHHGELKPFDAFWGQRYAVLHDPDGNGVDLYAPLS
ncbi:VOC family protein [Nocardia sp. alder85J]|uniref:VOC family protein n=1 Tax=Nocardia sp. alder85J TaxID=2862949 RepID=UPI001CD42982|nr:VOC family protein [Nocardia sp. alder85J]MCX4094932.1 VOC family protein [Nocardia sp. alder85J]